jgi:hypothetical protein
MSNGSFNRAEPTATGGELKKYQGDLSPNTDPNYDAEMETTMQQAEARGEYNPWNKGEEKDD